MWLYTVPGLILPYLYFQIPLMVITFMPALEGLKPQWLRGERDARAEAGRPTGGGSASRC